MSRKRFRLDSPGYPNEVTFLRAELDRRGWTETSGGGWNLLWSFEVPRDDIYRALRPGQKTNHFPGIAAMHFKDSFARRLQQAAAHVDRTDWFDFFPQTFSMVDEYDFWREVAAHQPDRIWILKPTQLTGGRGMRIVVDLDEVDETERGPGWIVQEYIADPLLLPDHPYKHVLRIYVLVTSLDPLIAYLYPDGPIKFTSRPFGTTPEELADRVRHLTNPSVQLTNTTVEDPLRLTSWADYRMRLVEAGHDPELLWSRLRHALTQAVIAGRDAVLQVSRHRCDRLESCYELLGFDVTVDSQLRPWVLECNASPSLSIRGTPGSASQAAHRQAKEAMIADSLTLLGVNQAGAPAAVDFVAHERPSDFEREAARRGRYQILYPAVDATRYRDCFESLTDADVALVDSLG